MFHVGLNLWMKMERLRIGNSVAEGKQRSLASQFSMSISQVIAEKIATSSLRRLPLNRRSCAPTWFGE